jgi:hypothetical protein
MLWNVGTIGGAPSLRANPAVFAYHWSRSIGMQESLRNYVVGRGSEFLKSSVLPIAQ